MYFAPGQIFDYVSLRLFFLHRVRIGAGDVDGAESLSHLDICFAFLNVFGSFPFFFVFILSLSV